MKKILAFFAFISVLCSAQAHEYYFAFGEVEYNESTRKLEITLELSAHDVEFDLKKAGIPLESHIEDQLQNTVFKQQLGEHLKKGFSISSDDSPVSLNLLGFDVMPNGLLYAYFESAPVELSKTLLFRFDLLMESFPNQQNKITFIRNKQKQTAVFLPTKPTELITF